MKKVVALFFAVLVTATAAASVVHAHSGGTNSLGCHAGSKPYHCH